MQKIIFEELTKENLSLAFYTTARQGSWQFEAEASRAAYEELAGELGIATSGIVRTKQTHTSCVKLVGAANGGEGVCRDYGPTGYDGMITNTPGLLLCTLEADCVPVYLLDPVARAVGMVHSGWRGTVGKIAVQGIRLMQESFGSQAQDIHVGIGPHICASCYEVGAELLLPFGDAFTGDEMKQIFRPEQGKPGKYLLNLQQAIRLSVLKEGILAEHFHSCGLCTYEDLRFDSYRRAGGTELRMLTGIMLL